MEVGRILKRTETLRYYGDSVLGKQFRSKFSSPQNREAVDHLFLQSNVYRSLLTQLLVPIAELEIVSVDI